MSHKGPANPERSFGLSVGAVLALIGGLLLWRGRVVAAEMVGTIGVVLLLLGVVRPALLKWPSAVWWRFARTLAYVNARIILTLMFALVLFPIGVLWRLVGRDPLARRRATWPGWSPHPARYRNRKHYERMF